MKKVLLIFLLISAGFGLGYSQNGNRISGNQSNNESTTGALEDVQPIYVPNAFTPNHDGINDIFYIPNARLNDFQITIFDRWGNQIFQSVNANFRWDGTINGKPVATGTYIYTLTATDTANRKVRRSGSISLVR